MIMTSNLGSDIIRDRMESWDNKLPPKEAEELQKEIFTLLKRSLRPEFLNRVDEIVMFHPLSREQIRDIVSMQISILQKTLDQHGMELEVTDRALDWLADNGYDPQLGARPVKRLIQREITNELSKQIIAGSVSKDDKVIIDVADDRLSFTGRKKA